MGQERAQDGPGSVRPVPVRPEGPARLFWTDRRASVRNGNGFPLLDPADERVMAGLNGISDPTHQASDASMPRVREDCRGLLSIASVKSGYRPVHPKLHRAINLSIGLALFLITLPMFTAMTLILLLLQGPHIFYKGKRLGQNKKIFEIYKFRTLQAGAAEITKDRVLPRDSGAETPLGKYFRESRLDELPQLLNVIRGDMNLCGPRPVRPEIAELCRRSIPDYDIRFDVTPGLIGYAQAYMSHDTSKRIRARYNKLACRAPVHYGWELLFLMRVGLAVLRRTASLFLDRTARSLKGMAAETAHPGLAGFGDVTLTLSATEMEALRPMRLSARSFDFVSSTKCPLGKRKFELARALPGGKRIRLRCVGEITAAKSLGDNLYVHSVNYLPSSDFSQYLLDRYVLMATVVSP